MDALLGEAQVELVFLDESGSAYQTYSKFKREYEDPRNVRLRSNKRPPPYPYFILVALAIPESKYAVVESWLREAKTSFFHLTTPQFGPEHEIKGALLYALREGKTPYEWQDKGRPRRYTAEQKRLWGALAGYELELLETSVFDLLGRVRPTVWAVVVKQAHLYRRYKARTWNPLDWALTYIQQRVCYHIQLEQGSYGRGLLIFDQTSSLATLTQFDRFFALRNTINLRAGWPTRFEEHLIDCPLPSPSHLLQSLQLADVVAHTMYRWARKQDPLGWFSRVEPLLARHWKTGEYGNVGLTVLS